MYGFGDAHPEDIRTDTVNLVEVSPFSKEDCFDLFLGT